MHHSIRKTGAPAGKLDQLIALKEAKALVSELKGWTLVAGKTLRKEVEMKDFMAAVRFIDAAARTAEAEGHHPDLHLTDYRRLVIEISTHAIGGLSMNDFILAEKLDRLHLEVKHPAHRIGAAAV
jgi:4a-hydroxytetrahydrobiopterin dehydratase